MKTFKGEVLFLDRSDINTDEIIPAKYLTENEKAALGPHLLEDLDLDGFDPQRDIAGKSVIITRSNFGCGSSREHAPWALEMNRFHTVIAAGFARIFRQNMFNCGMLAIDLPKETVDVLFDRFSGTGAWIDVDVEDRVFTVSGNPDVASSAGDNFSFDLSEFDHALIQSGGWIEYADARY